MFSTIALIAGLMWPARSESAARWSLTKLYDHSGDQITLHRDRADHQLIEGEGRDERSASAQTDRPFRRQHPVAGRRDGVPYPGGGGRTTPEAPAGRRDRHP